MDRPHIIDTLFRIFITAMLAACLFCLAMGVRAAFAAGDQRAIGAAAAGEANIVRTYKIGTFTVTEFRLTSGSLCVQSTWGSSVALAC